MVWRQSGLVLLMVLLTAAAGLLKIQEVSKEQAVSAVNTEEDYIHWVDFDVTSDALEKAYILDIESTDSDSHVNWVDLLSVLACKYGGDFSAYKDSDLDEIAEPLKMGKTTMEALAADMKYFDYYREAYGAVLDGMVGEYEVEVCQENGEVTWEKKYGLKAYSPIAKDFPYQDYDDFGASRSYGYKRHHLGHDMMGQVGTPIIAVESGYVEALGWNQYGGWRIGIRSFDKKRYYYYAHLRQNIPYAEGLEEGSIIQAGDVIGYLGRTGYSSSENVNNIDTYHLHFGLQLIFDESQKDGDQEIWIDCYQLVKFLCRNRSEVVRDDATKEWSRAYQIKDPSVSDYRESLILSPSPINTYLNRAANSLTSRYMGLRYLRLSAITPMASRFN